jgi:ActR/RegA family two-component response regulator
MPELTALLLTRDDQIVRVLTRLLGDMEIAAEHHSRVETALDLLARRRFDGVFADCDLDGAEQLLRNLRKSKVNQRSISFGLLSEQMTVRSAFELGANFVLYKPLSSERVKRSLRAGHGLMMREKRRHFRHAMNSGAFLTFGRYKELGAELIDVSTSGAAVKAPHAMEQKQNVEIRFQLPGLSKPVTALARAAWADRFGRAGLEFLSIPDDIKAELEQWMLERAMVQEDDRERQQAATAAKAAAAAEARAQAAAEWEAQRNAAAAATARSAIETLEAHFEVEADGAPLATRKRDFIRGQYEAPCVVATIREGESILVRGHCLDLSEEGLGAELDGEVIAGEPVLIELTLPDIADPLKLHAEVRHREGGHYGFEFVRLTGEHRQIVRRFTEQLPLAP